MYMLYTHTYMQMHTYRNEYITYIHTYKHSQHTTQHTYTHIHTYIYIHIRIPDAIYLMGTDLFLQSSLLQF